VATRTTAIDSTFSHAFGVARTHKDDWFDPLLHTDTELFVDPFLMFQESEEPWVSVHDAIIDFFNTALEHVAEAAHDRTSVQWRRAAAMLSFPEPREFCLGYGNKTIFGSGSASGLGAAMLNAAEEAIALGINNITDFGEILLFGEHFGADRVGDMVCNIAKDAFMTYTNEVIERHAIATDRVTIEHQHFDFEHDRWVKGPIQLPINPCWQPRTGVLLVPQRFLSELPKMDDNAFWDWVYNNQNAQLREDLGYHISQKVKRNDIIARAKQSLVLRRKYGTQYAAANRESPPQPYDFERDPSFKVLPFALGETIADSSRLELPGDADQFCAFVKMLATEFKWAVEDRGLSRAFWDGDRPRAERDVQDVFHFAVLLICKMRDVDVSPESNAGRGAVDFKFSAGWRKRSVVELKFARSSSFWDNLEMQPPTYLKAEGIRCGYIVVIQHEDAHCADEFEERVADIVRRVANQTKRDYEAVFVDVRRRPSASKVKRPRKAQR